MDAIMPRSEEGGIMAYFGKGSLGRGKLTIGRLLPKSHYQHQNSIQELLITYQNGP
jgi:hypothetical protein